MNNESVKRDKDDNLEEPFHQKDEYMGNIWGWRKSLIGGAIILAFLILVIVRYCQVQPDNFYIRESMKMEKGVKE